MAKKQDMFYFDNFCACADFSCQAAYLLDRAMREFDPVHIKEKLDEMHAIEHLGATFLRNDPDYKDRVLYFGPMGCRTGFYLLLAGDYESKDIIPLMKSMFAFIAGYEGEVPGASPKDCGNYLDMNLPMAKYLAGRYLKEVLEGITEERLAYPE